MILCIFGVGVGARAVSVAAMAVLTMLFTFGVGVDLGVGTRAVSVAAMAVLMSEFAFGVGVEVATRAAGAVGIERTIGRLRALSTRDAAIHRLLLSRNQAPEAVLPTGSRDSPIRTEPTTL